MNMPIVGLFAGLLLAVAAAAGGFTGFLLAIILGAVGYVAGLQLNGSVDVVSRLKDKRG